MKKIAFLSVLLTQVMSQYSDISCNTDQSDYSYAFCDLMQCSRDSDCIYFNCDNGVCWSWQGRPANCISDPTQIAYFCDGLACVQDTDCFNNNCLNNVCTYQPMPTVAGANCSLDPTQPTNKCPFVYCVNDNECQSMSCIYSDDMDPNGICNTQNEYPGTGCT